MNAYEWAMLMGEQVVHELEKEGYSISKWIPCSDRLPEKDTSVLICGAGHRVTAYYDAVFGVFRLTESNDLFYQKSAVTHWMPLPDLPELEEEKEGD